MPAVNTGNQIYAYAATGVPPPQTFTVDADDDLIVCLLSAYPSTSGTFDSVTWDVPTPESFTQEVTIFVSNEFRTDLWILPDPTAATDTLSFTHTSIDQSCIMFAYGIADVDTGDLTGVEDSNSGTGSTSSVTFTGTTSGSILCDLSASYGGSISSPSDTQIDLQNRGGGSDTDAGCQYGAGDGGNVTLSWSDSGSQWTNVGKEFFAAPAAGGIAVLRRRREGC